MVNEYTKELTKKNFENNVIKELVDMQNEYRQNGIPTILSDGLNELLLILSIKQPKTILELGTSVGCSGIAMLKTVKDATLCTVEKLPEIQKEALSNFKKYGVIDRVNSLVGDSVEVVKGLTSKFDFIFLDCNKSAYATLYPLLKNLLNDGGVIFADNVLFRGYVAKEKECPKKYKTLVQKIDNYNQLVASDSEMISCFFDVGDGIAVSYKK